LTGAHGIKVEFVFPAVDPSDPHPHIRVWIDDFTGHRLSAFSATGKQLLQIDNVFNAVVDTATESSVGAVYSADGDGSTANRVVKIELTPPESANWKVAWATPAAYRDPHSIALHRRTGLLFLASRGQNSTRLLRAADGSDLGELNCGLQYGANGVPYGVRTLSWEHPFGGVKLDLGLVAVMDNPQDGSNQYIAVVDFSQVSADVGTLATYNMQNAPCARS
jgi:hypothetical protein